MLEQVSSEKDGWMAGASSRESLSCLSDGVHHHIRSAYQQLQDLHRQALESQTLAAPLLLQTIDEFCISLEEIWLSMEDVRQNPQQFPRSDRYRDLFDSTPEPYLVTDTLGQIRIANRAASLLLHYPQPYLAHKPLSLFVSPSERQEFCARLEALDPSRLSSEEWQYRIQPLGDAPMPVVLRPFLLPTSDDWAVEVGWLIRTLNRQNPKDPEEMTPAAEFSLTQIRSQLIQILSHEFRTPLSVLRTSVDLLQRIYRDDLSEQHRKLFQLARNSVDTMTQMVDDVLFFSQTEEGTHDLHTSPVVLEPFCRQLVEEYRIVQSSPRSIQFDYRGEHSPVHTDEKLLRQILSNLLSNALKYSPADSSVEVTVSLRPHDQPDTFQIDVTDHGIGIPQAELDRLFDPFHRCKNVNQTPGTGLGLAIVKRAVTLLGGEIGVRSELGSGTTLSVLLPRICPLSLEHHPTSWSVDVEWGEGSQSSGKSWRH